MVASILIYAFFENFEAFELGQQSLKQKNCLAGQFFIFMGQLVILFTV